jgi:hypothetical protein
MKYEKVLRFCVGSILQYSPKHPARRHLEFDQKLFFYEKRPTEIQAQIKKTVRQNVQNSLSYSRKTKFSAIFKKATILKICEKNFPIF